MKTIKQLDEIEYIDKRSFQMAEAVVINPSKRPSLIKEAESNKNRLLYLVDKLEKGNPETLSKIRMAVSETLLDLDYVTDEVSSCISFRLNSLIQHIQSKSS